MGGLSFNIKAYRGTDTGLAAFGGLVGAFRDFRGVRV